MRVARRYLFGLGEDGEGFGGWGETGELEAGAKLFGCRRGGFAPEAGFVAPGDGAGGGEDGEDGQDRQDGSAGEEVGRSEGEGGHGEVEAAPSDEVGCGEDGRAGEKEDDTDDEPAAGGMTAPQEQAG